jgi:orotidine-5'-phosphate decarboxylase
MIPPTNNPIILALDYSNLSEASKMLDLVGSHLGMIKIGLELFTAHGFQSLELSKKYNLPVFLDLKLYDIPTTVEKTIKLICQQLSRYSGKHFLSVHCLGGKKMLQAAKLATQGSNVEIVGITLLTSLSQMEIHQFGFKRSSKNLKTIDLAEVAYTCDHPDHLNEGITTFVCDPNHVALMRKHYPNSVLITPGIRIETEDDDHVRSMTPTKALKNGSNWLVIGRPITQAINPLQEVLDIKSQIGI